MTEDDADGSQSVDTLSSLSERSLLFGRERSSGRMVSVHEVAGGLRCQCDCPHCELPLIARQGTVRGWHFAHHVDRKSTASEACTFGLASSIRAMAIQWMCEDGRLLLPAVDGAASLETARDGRNYEEYVHRPARELNAGPMSPGGRWRDHEFDAFIKIAGYTLFLFFSHYDRLPPHIGLSIKERDVCALWIDVQALWYGLLELPERPATAAAVACALEEAVRTDPTWRRWIYHPNLLECHEEAYKRLLDRANR